MRTILVLLVFTLSGLGQSNLPEFTDYPVKEIYNGKIPPLKITLNTKFYEAELNYAAKTEKVNFAGKYILLFANCGNLCLRISIINAKTGELPGGMLTFVDDLNEVNKLVKFNVNSRLLIIRGYNEKKDGNYVYRYYKLGRREFDLIKTVSLKQPLP